jgi:hypothetical protein
LKKGLRLIFDSVVCIAAIFVALYFAYQWGIHGFPLYGPDSMLGSGNRETILPWLSVSIVMIIVAVLAAFDFYAYKD